MTAASVFQQFTGLRAKAVPASEILQFPEGVFAQDSSPLVVAASRSGTTTEPRRAAKAVARQRWGSRAGHFSSADPFPASTHMDTLGLLVRHFQAAGAREITVADRSGMGDTRRVMAQKGVLALAGELGFRTVVLEDTPMEGWAEELLTGSHWSRGVLFARLFQEADLIVQTCCLKTHRYGGHFTLSLKNSVGQEQIARAVELGLGAQGPEQIDLVTDDPESRKVADRVREALRRG